MKLSHIEMDARRVGTPPPDMMAGTSSWSTRLRYQDRTLTTPYYMGPAHKGEPKIEDVLDGLISDTLSYDNANGDYEEWLSEFGTEPDTKSKQTFDAVKKQAAKVHKFFGAEWEEAIELLNEIHEKESRTLSSGIGSANLSRGYKVVRRWMEHNWKPHVDSRTGEVNMTWLAEAAAHEFERDEWLDDPDHFVWVAAADVMNMVGSGALSGGLKKGRFYEISDFHVSDHVKYTALTIQSMGWRTNVPIDGIVQEVGRRFVTVKWSDGEIRPVAPAAIMPAGRPDYSG